MQAPTRDSIAGGQTSHRPRLTRHNRAPSTHSTSLADESRLLPSESMILTRLDEAVAWGRKNSLWPMPFGTACCAIEYMSMVSSVYDISRFGSELQRFSPRQADLLIVAGTITYKMGPVLKRIHDQMCRPNWVMAMGVCASSGGFYDNYCTLQGIDKIIPVDYYIGGCPPRPESMFEAILDLQQRLQDQAGRASGQNER